MTALDRQLAKTFRAVRWAMTEGVPGCPDCFDGDDLDTPIPDPLTPGLSRYRCTVCHTEFSDVKGTVFQTSKPVPLALWAYLVLLGDPGRLNGMTQHELRRGWELFAKIKQAQLALDWRERLDTAGITNYKVGKYLDAARRAA